MFYPLIHELPYQDPIRFLPALSKLPGTVFLDSTLLMPSCGRYSFIAFDPFQTLISKNNDTYLNGKEMLADPFGLLEQELFKYFQPNSSIDIPFQGGVAGYLGYDLYRHLEKIDTHQQDDMGFPDMVIGFYDLVLAFDHLEKKAFIFSSGFPLLENTARKKRAEERCQWVRSILKANEISLNNYSESMLNEREIHSNFNRQQYVHAVNKIKNYILEGDIFEANISQRFTAKLPKDISCLDLYHRLKKFNPAPFSAYLSFNDITLVSASPERFLKLSNGKIETRPIKGTCRRSNDILEDAKLAETLLASEKDKAENVMIVDLLRNDLSRVCKEFSVEVTQLCGLESYATVHHLVSVITGELRESCNAIDLLRATFPGGSITGAPKIRAMEIIAEFEPTQRGPYCGSIGYIGFDGSMDTSITIRTFAIKNNIVTFQAGGAIVVDSDAENEYQETLTKAKALRRALSESLVDR